MTFFCLEALRSQCLFIFVQLQLNTILQIFEQDEQTTLTSKQGDQMSL
jgi:hypothetical protein